MKLKTPIAILFLILLSVLFSCSDDNGTTPNEEPEVRANRVWVSGDSVSAQIHLVLEVYVENNQPLTGLVVPLKLRGSSFSIDSVSLADSRFGQNQFSGAQIYPQANTLAAWFYPQAPEVIDTGSGVALRIYLWVWGNAPTQDIIIDTTTIELTTRFGYIDTAYASFMPEFEAGILHVDSIASSK